MDNLEQLRRVGLFEAPVPRYASFPPANRFTRGEGALYQHDWLRGVPAGSALSLYVHIPYCKNMCWFCACRTQKAESDDVIARYVDALETEIRLVRSEMASDLQMVRLHLGGGTPTILTPPQMQGLIKTIESAFPRADAFEFSVEVDTTCINRTVMQELAAFGIDRAIVGIQDFNPGVQKAIGRAQGFEQAQRVVQNLRAIGLAHLDLELLYGLPRQTAASSSATVQQALALEPDRIAVCEYTHVPHIAKRQIMVDARDLPDTESAFLMSQSARHLLTSDGYVPIGIDHYVRPNDTLIAAQEQRRLVRGFEGYSDNPAQALIGFGASAISRFPQGYVQNASATSAYTAKISACELAGSRGHALIQLDRLFGQMIDALMCSFEVDLLGITTQHPGFDALVDRVAHSLTQAYAGHIERSGAHLRIRPASYPLTRMICKTLEGLSASSRARVV